MEEVNADVSQPIVATERAPDPSAVMRSLRVIARKLDALNAEERARLVATVVILFGSERSDELLRERLRW